jgi:hypothetical protein
VKRALGSAIPERLRFLGRQDNFGVCGISIGESLPHEASYELAGAAGPLKRFMAASKPWDTQTATA